MCPRAGGGKILRAPPLRLSLGSWAVRSKHARTKGWGEATVGSNQKKNGPARKKEVRQVALKSRPQSAIRFQKQLLPRSKPICDQKRRWSVEDGRMDEKEKENEGERESVSVQA